MNRFVVCLVAMLPILGPKVSLAQDQPRYALQWKRGDASWMACHLDAGRALQLAGFGDLYYNEPMVFGHRGAYSAAVLCIATSGLIHFKVAGPDSEVGNRLLGQITQNF
jgi:hypothetical protein